MKRQKRFGVSATKLLQIFSWLIFVDHFCRIFYSENFVLCKLFLYFKQEVVKKPAPVNRYDRYDQERFDSQKGKMKLSVTLICDALRDLVSFVQLRKHGGVLLLIKFNNTPP